MAIDFLASHAASDVFDCVVNRNADQHQSGNCHWHEKQQETPVELHSSPSGLLNSNNSENAAPASSGDNAPFGGISPLAIFRIA